MKIIFSIFYLLFTGCTTFYESTQIGHQQPYIKTTNEKNEEVFRQINPVSNNLLITNPVNSNPVNFQETTSVSEKPNNEKSILVGYIDAAKSTNHFHLGLHAGFLINPFILPCFGVSFFNSDHDTYAGFDLSTRLIFSNLAVSPFVGLGGYAGDTKNCEKKNNVEICDKKFLYAGYTEAGIEFSHFNIFYRNYNINRAGISVPSESLIGAGIVFKK